MSFYSEGIAAILGLGVREVEYFKAMPLDVLAKVLCALEAKLEMAEDSQEMAEDSQDITIFIVQYFDHNVRWMQDCFTCPVSAALLYQDVIASIPESGACISTETVSTKQYQPERD